jgi:hypothetical protein
MTTLNTQTLKVITVLVKFTLERLERNLITEYAESLRFAVDDDYPDIIDDFTGEVFEAVFGAYPPLDLPKYRYAIAQIAEEMLINAV